MVAHLGLISLPWCPCVKIIIMASNSLKVLKRLNEMMKTTQLVVITGQREYGNTEIVSGNRVI